MTKLEFLLELNEKLSPLPAEEIAEHWAYYSEMIDDRMEEGASEEAAVAAIGTVEEIAAQIVTDIPFRGIVKESVKPKRRLTGWEITLLVLGSPVWISLLIAAAAVVFSLYVSLWAVIISCWSVFASTLVCALGGLMGAVACGLGGRVPTGIVLLGAALVCAGLSIFLFFGCRWITRGFLRLTKKAVQGAKNSFFRREERCE